MFVACYACCCCKAEFTSDAAAPAAVAQDTTRTRAFAQVLLAGHWISRRLLSRNFRDLAGLLQGLAGLLAHVAGLLQGQADRCCTCCKPREGSGARGHNAFASRINLPLLWRIRHFWPFLRSLRQGHGQC